MTCRALAPCLCVLVLLAGCRPASEPAGIVEAETAEAPAAAPARSATISPSAPMVPEQVESGANAPANDAQTAAQRREMLALADTVARQGDVHALSLAALLRTSALSGTEYEDADSRSDHLPRMDDTVRDWLDRAQRQAPDDVVALVVALNLERFDEGRRQALIARWRALEPDNLVTILYARLPEAALFDAAANTTVYDSHYDDFLRAMFQTLLRNASVPLLRARARQAGVEPQAYILTTVIAYAAAVAMPSFQQVTRPCGESAMVDFRRAQCRWIAGILLHRSDTSVSEMIGAAMARRLAESPAERQEAEEARREISWIVNRATDAYQRDQHGQMKRFAELLTGEGAFTEQSVMRQLIVEAGYPHVPPPGWQPGQQP